MRLSRLDTCRSLICGSLAPPPPFCQSVTLVRRPPLTLRSPGCFSSAAVASRRRRRKPALVEASPSASRRSLSKRRSSSVRGRSSERCRASAVDLAALVSHAGPSFAAPSFVPARSRGRGLRSRSLPHTATVRRHGLSRPEPSCSWPPSPLRTLAAQRLRCSLARCAGVPRVHPLAAASAPVTPLPSPRRCAIAFGCASPGALVLAVALRPCGVALLSRSAVPPFACKPPSCLSSRFRDRPFCVLALLAAAVRHRCHRVVPRALVLGAALAPAARLFGSRSRSACGLSPLPSAPLSHSQEHRRSLAALCAQATLVCALSPPRPCLQYDLASPRRYAIALGFSPSPRARGRLSLLSLSPSHALSGTVVRPLRPRAQAAFMPPPPLSRERVSVAALPLRGLAVAALSRGWLWVPSTTRRRWAGDAAAGVACSRLRDRRLVGAPHEALACPLHLHRRA